MEFPVEIYLPGKTIFKKGAINSLASETLEFGCEGILIHGRSLLKNGKLKKILSQFPPSARIAEVCRSGGEPALEEITSAIEEGKKINAKWVIGIGGGSVLDLAKAVAGLFNAKEQPAYYQQNGVLKECGIPFIAVPTTAGTGAEATINAVIINNEKRVKLSIREKSFIARKVILDPDLLKDLPQDVISSAGMDALVQAYESFTSKYATRFTDVMALRAIALINQNILAAYKSPNDENLAAMLAGSYYAGIALAHSRLGVIHGIAHPLGILYGKPHGQICAVCLPASIKLNKTAMGNKYAVLTRQIGIDFFERAQSLIQLLLIKSPFKGRDIIEKEKIVKETLESGSTAANPKQITREDIEFLLKELF